MSKLIRIQRIFVILCFFMCFQACKKEPLTLKQRIEKSNTSAVSWLINNFKDKGIFVYVYNPKKDFYPKKNNMIRQLMASRILADLSQNDSNLKKLHKNNLNFIFNNWYKEKDDIGYILYNNKSKLGANAMALRTLVYSPYFEEYKDKAKKLADSIIKLMNTDGSFEPFYIQPSYSYDKDYMLTFYSGEALLSLFEYYNKTKDERYLKLAQKSQDFYVNRYVNELEKNYYPAYVPWHTQSLSALYKITKDKKYADAIFTLNDKVLELQDTTNHIGRFYNPNTPQYGKPHASSDGVYTEGLAYAYEIALLLNDKEHADKYLKAINIAVDNLISLQYKTKDKKTNGALRTKKGKYSIRTDTTQHTIDAYRKLLEIL